MVKRIISILLVIATLASLAACGREEEQEPATTGTQNLGINENSISRGSFVYEDEYTQQHLAFIDSDGYAFAIKEYHGMVTTVSDCYLEAKTNYINGAWTAISNVAKLIDGEEVDLFNEYELLVAELMFNTGAQASFASTFETNYYDAAIELLDGISKILEDSKSTIGHLTADDIKKVEGITEYLDWAIELLAEEKDQESKPQLFASTLEEVKSKFNETYLGDNEKLVKKVKDTLGTGAKIGSFLSDNLTDIFEEYMIRKALTEASAEWESIWGEISSKLKDFAGEETDKTKAKIYTKLSASIDHVLAETALYREHEIVALVQTATEKIATNLIIDAGKALLDKVMEKCPPVKMIKSGVQGGVATCNMLTNSTNIAYYGQMLLGYGGLAESIYLVLLDAESDLRTEKTYSSALLFDQAFHTYKDFQIASMDCTSNYYLSIVENAVSKTFLNTHKMGHSMAYDLIIKKSDLKPIHCHGIDNIYNNGGYVVGYKGDLYYFKSSENTQAQTGIYGNYNPDTEVDKCLVRRNKDGKEVKLLNAPATGRIFICREKLLYEKYDGWWYSVGLDGKNEKKEIQAYITSYLPREGMLVVQTGETDVYATDFTGNVAPVPYDYDPRVLCNNAGVRYYYSKEGSDTFKFYSVDDQFNRTELGTITQSADPRSSAVLTDYCVTSNGIYVLVGTSGGSGMFFSDGTIYRIPYGGRAFEKIAYDVNYDRLRLVMDGTGEYIYYGTFSYSTVAGLYAGAVEKGVKCLNVSTGDITDSQMPLQSNGTVFLRDGQLQVLHQSQKEPMVILSKEDAKENKIGQLGEQADGSCLYHEWMQLVDDTYYALITKAVPDEASSVGWRQGYKRVSSTLYAINTEDGKVTTIYSY